MYMHLMRKIKHEQDNEDNQNNISSELVEYLPQDSTLNHNGNNNGHNNHNMNESDELPLLAHIAQRSPSIKDTHTNRLSGGDLNRLLSSNKNKFSTMTTHKDETSVN